MFESVELGFNRCVFNVIGCLSLLFFRLNSRWPLILWTLTIVAARESRSLSTWMARVPMKRAPIPRRCPLCLPFLFGVSTDACVSTRGCAVTYRGCFPHCSIASVLESNLHFLGCITNSDLQREVMDIFWCSCWESILRIGTFRLLACGMPSHCPPLSAGSWWTSKLSALPKLPVMFPAMQLLFIKKVSFFCLTLTAVKHTPFSVKIRPVWSFILA